MTSDATLVFIEKAKKVHGGKYDYSKVDYKGTNAKVLIICPTHGEFEQTANNHSRGRGCLKCGINDARHNNMYTTLEWILKAKNIHGDKYDYTNVNYKGKLQKVKIACRKCFSSFMQNPSSHLQGYGCSKCSNKTKKYTKNNKFIKDTETFVLKAKEIHGDKYDYCKTNYINAKQKVLIICPTHGEFEQIPNTHISKKSGCFKCGKEETTKKLISNSLSFIAKAKEIHGDKYDYSKVDYKKNNTKVLIICPTHGEFEQPPNKHLSKRGCSLCGRDNSNNKRMSNIEEFIIKAKKIHGNKYDYSKSVYNGDANKILIKCSEHGYFFQKVTNHLQGNGCPKCSLSKGEETIRIFLVSHDIKFQCEISSKELFPNNLFITGYKETRFDFIIESHKLLIEFDGEQHFKAVSFGANEERAKKDLLGVKQRDKIKDELVQQSEYSLIRIPFWEINNIEKILSELFQKSNKLNKKIIEDFTYEKNQKKYKNIYE